VAADDEVDGDSEDGDVADAEVAGGGTDTVDDIR